MRKGRIMYVWVRLRFNSLALRHHLAIHGTGTAIAAVANTGQTAGGHPAIGAAVGRSQRLGLGLVKECVMLRKHQDRVVGGRTGMATVGWRAYGWNRTELWR